MRNITDHIDAHFHDNGLCQCPCDDCTTSMRFCICETCPCDKEAHDTPQPTEQCSCNYQEVLMCAESVAYGHPMLDNCVGYIDVELPGMWESSDFTGGATDTESPTDHEPEGIEWRDT